MDSILDEKQFFEILDQFQSEYREEILEGLRKNSKEYKTVRSKFGEMIDRMENLCEELGGDDKDLIEKFLELHSEVVFMESNQIYLQGQIDGMRIIKKLNQRN